MAKAQCRTLQLQCKSFEVRTLIPNSKKKRNIINPDLFSHTQKKLPGQNFGQQKQCTAQIIESMLQEILVYEAFSQSKSGKSCVFLYSMASGNEWQNRPDLFLGLINGSFMF